MKLFYFMLLSKYLYYIIKCVLNYKKKELEKLLQMNFKDGVTTLKVVMEIVCHVYHMTFKGFVTTLNVMMGFVCHVYQPIVKITSEM